MKLRKPGDNGLFVSAVDLGCTRMSGIVGRRPSSGLDADLESIGAALEIRPAMVDMVPCLDD